MVGAGGWVDYNGTGTNVLVFVFVFVFVFLFVFVFDPVIIVMIVWCSYGGRSERVGRL